VPRKVAFPVACTHQDAAAAGIPRKFHIAVTIPDHEGTGQIEAMLVRRALQQTGAWFSAGTVISGCVRAVVNRINVRVLFAKLISQECVHLVHERLGEIFSSDSRLVGYHDNREAGEIQSSDGGGGEGKDTQTAGVIQVADFFAQGAVAIEKHCGARLQRDVNHAKPP
jgi:hypothetical protein